MGGHKAGPMADRAGCVHGVIAVREALAAVLHFAVEAEALQAVEGRSRGGGEAGLHPSPQGLPIKLAQHPVQQ